MTAVMYSLLSGWGTDLVNAVIFSSHVSSLGHIFLPVSPCSGWKRSHLTNPWLGFPWSVAALLRLPSARQSKKPARHLAASSWYTAQFAHIRTGPKHLQQCWGRGSCNCTCAPSFSSPLLIRCQQLHWGEHPSFSRHLPVAHTYLLHCMPLDSQYLGRDLNMESRQSFSSLSWIQGSHCQSSTQNRQFLKPEAWESYLTPLHKFKLHKIVQIHWKKKIRCSKSSVGYCWCRWDECIPF